MKLEPIRFTGGTLFVLDQLEIPHKIEEIEVVSVKETYDVIRNMNVRGAPLIGFTALYGMVYAAKESSSFGEFEEKANFIKTARPTAVNLVFEVDSCIFAVKQRFSEFLKNEIVKFCENFARDKILNQEIDNKRTADLIINKIKKDFPDKKKFRVLTICNTGRLACGTTGTALGVISEMQCRGILDEVFACETRPYLQGSRLTAFELVNEKIKHFIIPDGATSYVLENHNVDVVLVGADRIAANGDTANKIGTNNLGIIADRYNIPFYVVAPLSSFDFSCRDGTDIEIELRDEKELLRLNGEMISPLGARGLNPAFDITSCDLITGLCCEKGVFKPTDLEGIKND